MADITIIGGGISGLSIAAFLSDADHNVQVLEAGDSAGGNVRTDVVDGRICDRGANGWLNNEPAMDRLIERLSLTGAILPASDRIKARYIYADGQLLPAPLSPLALLKTPLFSAGSKLRLLGEPFVAAAPPDQDESVASFLGRRLGSGLVDRMVAPMVAGIHAARPDQISVRAAFPRLWSMEQEHGSLLRGMMRRDRSAVRGRLTSLNGGVGVLSQRIADLLGDRLRTNTAVTAIERTGDQWQVHTTAGAQRTDVVILACPAHAQAQIINHVDREATAALQSIPYAPVAVVVSAWHRDTWPRNPDGFGALVAQNEDLGGVLGTLFTSCIFPDHAPEHEHLFRCILGGAVHPDIPTLDDQQLLSRCTAAFNRFFGPSTAAPKMVRIYRNNRAIPQYTPGHIDRIATIQQAQQRHHGLWFAGNHIGGVGVKDCVRQGEHIAQSVLHWLSSKTIPGTA